MSIAENKPLPPSMSIRTIEKVTIDGNTQAVHASLAVTVDSDPNELQFVYDVNLTMTTDPELAEIGDRLRDLIEARVRDPLHLDRQTKCDACSAPCCSHYTQISVMEEDLPGLMRATGAASLDQLREMNVIAGSGGMGTVGFLGRVVPDGDGFKHESTCPFISWTEAGVGRCGIYENRPSVCRQYSERECGMQEAPDPELYQIRPAGERPARASIMPGSRPFDLEKWLKENPCTVT